MKLPKLFRWSEFDPIPEGIMAHDIKDENTRTLIMERYNKVYRPPTTPYTNPEKYDPFNPPKGWAFDPHYECWIQLDE